MEYETIKGVVDVGMTTGSALAICISWSVRGEMKEEIPTRMRYREYVKEYPDRYFELVKVQFQE